MIIPRKITAMDFKWGDGQKRVPGYFAKNYPDAEFKIINRDNYLEFIL